MATADRIGTVRALLASIDRRLGGGGALDVRFEGFPVLSGAIGDAGVAATYREAGYRSNPWATAIVDLTAAEEEFFAALPKAVRKALRRAEREGLRVEECLLVDDYELEYVEPFIAGRRLQGLGLPSRHALMIMWCVGHESTYRFFICRDGNGEVLAMLGTYRFNGLATEIMSGRSPAGLASASPAQDLLHWRVMRAHRERGEKAFDLAGFNPSPSAEKEIGIRRFKEKWGGHIVPFDRWAWRVPTAAQRVKKMLH